MKIYLVRHGETNNNLLGQARILGGNDPLNQTGISQAEAAAEFLAGLDPKIELVIASPLQRTQQTAQIISQKLNIAGGTNKNLAECDFGDWEGQVFTEVAPLYENSSATRILDFRPPNGESWRDLAARMVRTINDCRAQNYQALVLVSHREPIRCAVAGLLDGFDSTWPSLPKSCGNGATFGFEFLDGQWHLMFANKTS